MSELELYKGMVKKMKDDEIKEKMTIGKAKKILRGFLAKDCYYDTPLYYAIPYLLDYITNLQQENEVLENEKDMFYKVSQERLNKWLSLNDENNKLVEIIKDYKSRIEKAVEIAKDLKQFVYDELVDRNVSGATETHDKIINLLNTLNGRSDE